jgi:hypothetical protein
MELRHAKFGTEVNYADTNKLYANFVYIIC